jgi:prepilin-type N-terminal cleavage/methylation domain-containing protein/prepilin-type processing-associated H-X9-DG protein
MNSHRTFRSPLFSSQKYRPELETWPPSGFTLVELLVVISVVAVLAALLLPALAKAGGQDQAIQCLNNCNKLVKAWTMYAADNNDACANNFGVAETDYVEDENNPTVNTWCLDVMDWATDPQNTNTTLLQEGQLGPYIATSIGAFKCPADNYLSSAQIAAGFKARVRSYSMNCFLGYFSPCADCVNGAPGSGMDTTFFGRDWANPSWPQYLTLGSIPLPSQIFVFLDEHPNTINDGYFDTGQYPPDVNLQWGDMPGSYHNGAGSFAFSDGHAEIHKWVDQSTDVPIVPGGAWTEPTVGPDFTDRHWICAHSCVK